MKKTFASILFIVLSCIYSINLASQVYYKILGDYEVEVGLDDHIPYQLIDVKPTFMEGGREKFLQWVSSKMIYPLKAAKQGISGRVTIQFIIERDGSVTNVKVLRGPDMLLNQEAARIVRNSPKWTPGMHRDELARCSYIVPIIFDLAMLHSYGMNNGYEWVDLGLSVRWATCNLGASKPYGYGDYYSWGALATYNHFDQTECTTFNVAIDDISARQEYDAARVNRGGTWRLPTKEECEELIKNCIWTWSVREGVYGYEVRSKVNNNSIFLPASGYYDSEYQESNIDLRVLGNYWTSTPAERKFGDCYMNEAYVLRFTSNGPYTMYYNKYYGHTIRPVCD